MIHVGLIVCHLDDVWVSLLRNNQMTPTVQHVLECYPLNYAKLRFCGRGGQIRMRYVDTRC